MLHLVKLCESSPHLALSCFRFYLCLFSGPSTFLPKVRRDSDLHHMFFGFPSCGAEPSTSRKGSGLDTQAFWGVVGGLRDLQSDLRALWFLQGLNEIDEEEEAKESTFTNER